MAGIGLKSVLGLPAQVGGAVFAVPELVASLADVAEPLQGAAERVGRLADRFPRRRAGRS